MEMTSVRGLNPKRIPDLVQKDVEFAKTRALGFFRILPDLTVEFEWNRAKAERVEPMVSVLSVIGPSRGFGKEFEEALLMEVGMARARPYGYARGIGWKRGEKVVAGRRKWFCPTPEQYHAVAPLLFKTLQEKTDKVAGRWKTTQHFLPFTHQYWLKREQRMEERPAVYWYTKGVHFSASVKDPLFMADIYHAELVQNWTLRGYIDGIARYFGWTFKFLKGQDEYARKFIKKHIGKKKILAPYHRHELLRNFAKPRDKENRLKLIEILGLNGTPPEQQLAASVLPEAEKRTGQIQLRVVKSLDSDKDHIVFEVLPSAAPTPDTISPTYSQEEEDEPF